MPTNHPLFDSHTRGSQYVMVEDSAVGVHILPGDVISTRANLRGRDGNWRYIPTGFATGSQQRCLQVMQEVMTLVGGDIGRVVTPHDPELWSEPHLRRHADGLHVAEVCLRSGDHSRL